MKQFSRINLYWSKLLLSLSFVVVLNKANCQNNLLSNGGFDYYVNNCFSINNAIPWYNPTTSSPDYRYFQACVMFNPVGYLWPHNGYAYVGMYFMQKPFVDAREYISSPLSSTLTTGKNYCISLYWYRSKCNFAIKTLGVLFTSNAINHNNSYLIPQTPQLEYTGSHLTDSTQWNLMQFTYMAQGNENYITLGNFKSDATCDTLRLKYTGNINDDFAYYYIDDVSVVELINANAGKDTLVNYGDSTLLGGPAINAAQYQWQPTQGLSCSNCPNPKASPASTTIYTLTLTQCSQITTDTVQISINGTGINEINKMQVKVYPNPVDRNSLLNIEGEKISRIEIYDIHGKLLRHEEFKSLNRVQLKANFDKGLYLLRIKNSNETIFTHKLILE